MLGFLQNALLYVVPFLLVLTLVVTVHELGHFLVAKWCGVAIDRFSIGFGRAIFSRRDRSGVEWRIGWIPLGGYVMFAGDKNASSVPDEEDLDALRRDIASREGEEAVGRYFHFKPIWQRALVTVAGPVANFLLAIAVFSVLLMSLGQYVTPAQVGAVTPNSAADRAGFKTGDVILRADGHVVEDFGDVAEVAQIRVNLPTEFVVRRGAGELLLTATPAPVMRADAMGTVRRLGTLGFRQAEIEPTHVRYGPIEAVQASVERTGHILSSTVYYLGRMVRGQVAADQLSGPLGIAHISGKLAEASTRGAPDLPTVILSAGIALLQLAATLSVGIGFMNLLPVPVLDGGHLLFYAYEAATRRPLAAKVQAAGYRVGLALVLGLMLFATWNDLQQLRVFKFLGGPFS
ncbi:MAG TPA: RIP metalloprotease [Phenylobacterium sp.]|nr:RIP metalloprotease [Phenylobacterium sp.]